MSDAKESKAVGDVKTASGDPDVSNGPGCSGFCGRLCAGLRAEFTWQKFDMKLTRAEMYKFGKSAFMQDVPAVFMVYRIFVACYFLGVMCWSISTASSGGTGGYWLVYWTNWCTMQQVLYLFMAAATTFLYNSGVWSLPELARGERVRPPTLMLLTWISQNIIYPSSILVLIFYWTLVFPSEDDGISPISIQSRMVNSVLMLVDLFCSGAPYRFVHCYQGSIYGAIFCIWTGIHYAAEIGDGEGNRHIYGVLNWKHGGLSIGTTIFVIFYYPLINFVLWSWWFLGNEVSDEERVFRGRRGSVSDPVQVGPAAERKERTGLLGRLRTLGSQYKLNFGRSKNKAKRQRSNMPADQAAAPDIELGETKEAQGATESKDDAVTRVAATDAKQESKN